jgi:hypothetical protein
LPQPEGDSVQLRWAESEGPPVSVPIHRRFGSVIIERNLAHAIHGEVQLSFLQEGVVCDIHIPPAQLVGFAERTPRNGVLLNSARMRSCLSMARASVRAGR